MNNQYNFPFILFCFVLLSDKVAISDIVKNKPFTVGRRKKRRKETPSLEEGRQT